jgi:hypothetical protein
MLKTFTASEQWPAMLARAKPMNHHQMQNEGGGEETSQKREEASPSQIEQMVTEGRVGIFAR